MLSIFLKADTTPEELEKAEKSGEGWRRTTDMTFTLVNPVDAARSIINRANLHHDALNGSAS